MKTIISFLLVLLVIPTFGQKMGNGYGNTSVASIATDGVENRLMNQLQSLNSIQPIGANQFRDSYMSGMQPVRFAVYPNPAHNWLAADFPANRNIRFVRILNVAGQVVGTYHMWDRQFYIGHLESGMYVVQFVQNNFMAHSTAFYKR